MRETCPRPRIGADKTPDMARTNGMIRFARCEAENDPDWVVCRCIPAQDVVRYVAVNQVARQTDPMPVRSVVLSRIPPGASPRAVSPWRTLVRWDGRHQRAEQGAADEPR